METLDNVGLACLDVKDLKTLGGSAVLLTDDDLLRNVYKTACEVTGVRGSQRGVGKTLTRTTRGDEVFENVKTLTVVSSDRDLDGLTGGVGDKSAHSGKLTDLAHATTRTGICHHKDRVVAVEVSLERAGNVVGRLCPDVEDLLITLLVGAKTHHVFLTNGVYLFLGSCDDLFLFGRDNSVANRNGDRALG